MRGHMADEFLDGLDVERRANLWRELAQDPNKIILVAEDVAGLSRTAPSRMRTTGKGSPSARFVIVLTCKQT